MTNTTEVIYEIHYTLEDGLEYYVILQAESRSLLQKLAHQHITKVKGKDPWSRKIQDNEPDLELEDAGESSGEGAE